MCPFNNIYHKFNRKFKKFLCLKEVEEKKKKEK